MSGNTPNAPGLLSRRYVLRRELGRGGMGIVYEALDRLTGERVALKSIPVASGRRTTDASLPSITQSLGTQSLPPEEDAPAALLEDVAGTYSASGLGARKSGERFLLAVRTGIIQEFRILASLRHPYIISVLDYGLDAVGDPFFTMELLGEDSQLKAAARGTPLLTRVGLLVQITRALTYLHRRGILHRDLKPANVLVSQVGAGLRVKVLDFGLAIAANLQNARSALHAGTLAYMAPEQLQGAPPSEASDLYALGITAYELLTDSHPFETRTEKQLRADILQREPDLDRIAGPPALRELIAQLLAKSPQLRPRDAGSVALLLSRAAGLPPGDEETEVRDSFLQSAALVGRTRELGELLAATDRLVNGTGGALLVGGESGVGKSRLLEETRVAALVRGALVLRGQATDSGSSAHLILRELLSHLVLQLEPPPSDFEAGVLLPLIPELAALLQKEVIPAPELDAKATQERLFEVIEASLKRLNRPVVLMLDDLQWIGSDTLALLQRVLRHAATSSVLLLGGYRDDEAPRLPALFPDAQVVKLNRLDAGTIGVLSEAMLGPGGRRPELVELLTKETAGNVFFMVEVLRALAEEAGQLSAIGQHGLPQQVVSGGILNFLARRLNRVSPAQRRFLELAAVMGRQLDLPALRTVVPALQLENFLHSCAEHAIVEPVESHWRFCHDKLRERLQESLSSERARTLHAQAAHAIEAAYPDPRQHATEIARHYVSAGEVVPAARYLILAGETALSQGALGQAERLLGEALSWQQRCPPQARTLPQELHLRRLHAGALAGLGRLAECLAELETMMALVGFPFQEVDARFVVSLAVQLGTQLLGDWPRAQRATDHLTRDGALELLNCFELAATPLVMRNESARMLYICVLGVNLAQRFGSDEHLALFSCYLSYALYAAQLHGISRRYLDKAIAVAPRLADPRVDEGIAKVLACVAQFRGRWVEVEKHLGNAIAVCRPLGDTTRDLMHMLLAMSNHYFRAQYPAALVDADRLQRAAQQSQNAQFHGWSHLARAAVAIQHRDYAQAHTTIAAALPLVAVSQDIVAEHCCLGLRALTALHTGRLAEAQHVAELVLTRIASRPISGHGMMEGNIAPIEVFFTLWRTAAPGPERTNFLRLMRRALSQLRRYARLCEFAAPRLLLWEAVIAQQEGKPFVPFLYAGLRAAERFVMPLEIALAHAELSRCAAATEQPHALIAQQKFVELGIPWRLLDGARSREIFAS